MVRLNGTFAGHAALRKFMAQYSASRNGGGVRHMITNVSFDVQGDEATGTCGLIYFKVQDGKSEYQLTGGYNDQLRKVAGEWLFTYRKVYLDGCGPCGARSAALGRDSRGCRACRPDANS